LAVKHKLVCAVVAIALLVPALSFAGPLVFSMSPGQGVQSAQVGLSMGKFMPYFGLDLMGISGKVKADYEYTDSYYDTGEGAWVDYVSQKSTVDASAGATLLIPHIGARFYFATEPLKPYVFLGFLKSMPFVSAKISGTDNYFNPDGTSDGSDTYSAKLEGDAKDVITKPLGFWGMNLGFGAEYPFSENFSLGGEYGLRWFHTSTESSGLLGDEMSAEMSASLKLTTARVVLNYNF
jgi:hypothetical protein